ncbi:hypothetical protein LCGC14_0429940 [marine sediment metagenome]|uniref:Uncharacterized protein n=1 Tax=marine sediment metagenome TaxID=412755 RepID=A0A0F9VXW5_9ZZZZ
MKIPIQVTGFVEVADKDIHNGMIKIESLHKSIPVKSWAMWELEQILRDKGEFASTNLEVTIL